MEIVFDILLAFAVMFAGFMMGIILHEAGHLVCGLLTKYRFKSYRVFGATWFERDGRVKFAITKGNGLLGQCLMAPPQEEAKFHFVLYNLGGGLFNLLTAAVLYGIMRTVDGNSTAFALLAGGVGINVCLGLSNLIPMQLGVPNDGMNVIMASKSKEAKHSFYTMLRANGELQQGKRIKDFPKETFIVSENADVTNYHVAMMVISEADRLYDVGEYAASVAQLDRLHLNKLQAVYRGMVEARYAYHYLVHQPDLEKARQLYAQPSFASFKKLGIIPVPRVLAAYAFFAEKDRENAKALMAKAKAKAETYPVLGIKISEVAYLSALEKLMSDEMAAL